MGILNKRMKINKVSLDFANYYYYIRGVEKSGKTTLFRDLILELYGGDASKGLLVAVGREQGYKALDNLNAIDAYEWDDFEEIVDELVDNKDKLGIKFVCVDTLDELISLAEEKVLALGRAENPKVKSLNGCFGGYGAGRKKLCEMVDEKLAELKRAGYGLLVLGHTKIKTIKEQGMEEGQEYMVLTGNLNTDYDNIVAHKADVIATISIDKNIADNKVLNGTTRWLNFRNDGFVNCGARFSNIVDRVELSARGFVNAIEDAMKNSMTKPMDDDKVKELKKEQIKQREEKAKEFIESKKEIDVEKNEELIKEIQSKFISADNSLKDKIKQIMKDNDMNKFVADENKTSVLEEILKVLS